MDEERSAEDLSLWADRRLAMRASTIQGVGTFATEPIEAGTVLTRATGGLVEAAAERAAGECNLAVELYAQDEIAPDVFRVL